MSCCFLYWFLFMRRKLYARYEGKAVINYALNKEEKQWMDTHENTIRVGYLKDNLPFCGEENGKLTGILGTVLDTVQEKYGITIKEVPCSTGVQMNEVDDDRYDLIFMDIQMPKMDGYIATREIRTLKNNKKANIPIIAMTANAFEEDKKKAFKAGMNAHITKPIDIETILTVLNQVFGTPENPYR